MTPTAEPAPLTHLALAGKSLRGTRRRGEAVKVAVHALGLSNVTEQYMWKQQAFTGKGQAPKGYPQAALALIDPLDLHKTVVSADALHTQPKWAQAIPGTLWVRQHCHIENRSQWRRAVTLGEDACLATVGQVPQVLAALNNARLALVDFFKRPNLAATLRFFNAFPDKALDLLLFPPAAQARSLFV